MNEEIDFEKLYSILMSDNEQLYYDLVKLNDCGDDMVEWFMNNLDTYSYVDVVWSHYNDYVYIYCEFPFENDFQLKMIIPNDYILNVNLKLQHNPHFKINYIDPDGIIKDLFNQTINLVCIQLKGKPKENWEFYIDDINYIEYE